MNTVNKALLGAAVLQAVLVGVAWFPRGDGATEPRELLGFPVDDIQTMTLHDRTAPDEPAAPPAVLTRTDTGWVLTSADDFPADEELVKPLLENLGKLKVRAPVAVKEESQSGLEVSETLHTRKIEIVAKNGTKRVLFFGAGQGNNSHVRVDGEVEAYELKGVSAWSFAVTNNRYFDRDGFLKVDASTVKRVTLERPGTPPTEFWKTDSGAWTMTGLAPDQALDLPATNNWITSLLTIRMLEPGPRTATPDQGFDGGTKVTWVDDQGATHHYVVGAEVVGETGRRWVKSDHQPWSVKVLKGNVTAALEGTFDKLLATPIVDLPPP